MQLADGTELSCHAVLLTTGVSYRKRSVWVELLFAEGKDWNGMRRYRLRHLWRVNCEALVRAAGQNLKWLLKKREWGGSLWPEGAENALLFGLFSRLQRFFSEMKEGRGFRGGTLVLC